MPEVEQVLDLIERKYDSQVFCHKLVPDTINFEMVKALASVASVASLMFIKSGQGFKPKFVTQATEAAKSVVNFYSVQKVSIDSIFFTHVVLH